MDHVIRQFYRLLLVLSCLSMVAALLAITLNIATRLVDGWSISGLDGYAGYSIAAAFFLALPSAFEHGNHIRVTSVLDHVPPRVRAALVTWGLVVGLLISSYLAWFSGRLVWMSHLYHDVAPTGDATPMWIPQLSMALGTVGFAVAFLHALVCQLRGQAFFLETAKTSTRSE
ncbi:TRAP transporter small permease [Rhodoferax sp.]|uniref:TRAP transporter small permease n=1 Tax=Rhodoferax sp. TaxID=50421 RepID=UPI0019ECAFBA|nr:TRAP transporter small permease [Rhodoferax sp.]MBE0473998.1 TRAP transporter small permease subunit [Rhodoferax sp.]